MYLSRQVIYSKDERVMMKGMLISAQSSAKTVMVIVLGMFVFACQGQITYIWEGSKEGWVPASETSLGCNLIEQPEAMAMRAFNATPVMRSGTLSMNLGIDASDYDRVQITLKNPTSSGNPNARLFAYPPESNAFMCHWNVPVDTAMTEFQTYTLDLTTPPNGGSGSFEGEVARFGWRGPWGVANGDTIYWKSMMGYSSVGCTNSEACNYAPLAETDNGMCVLVGDSCDDGNPETLDDMINADCLCSGEVDQIHDVARVQELELGPNPSAVQVRVRSDRPLGTIRVLDLQGRVWMREETSEFNLMIDVTGLTPGTYIVEATGQQGRMTSQFVVHRP